MALEDSEILITGDVIYAESVTDATKAAIGAVINSAAYSDQTKAVWVGVLSDVLKNELTSLKVNYKPVKDSVREESKCPNVREFEFSQATIPVWDFSGGGGGGGGGSEYITTQDLPSTVGATGTISLATITPSDPPIEVGKSVSNSNGTLIAKVTAISGDDVSVQTIKSVVAYKEPFIYTQTTASTTWVITHNMGFQYPTVLVVDNNGTYLVPGIAYNSANVTTLYFAEPTTGKAIVKL
jgi:hypothetical protein